MAPAAFTWLNEHPGQVAEGQGVEGSVGHPQAVRPGPFIRKERNNEEGHSSDRSHSSLSGPTRGLLPNTPLEILRGNQASGESRAALGLSTAGGLGPDPLPCSSRASRLFHAAAR